MARGVFQRSFSSLFYFHFQELQNVAAQVLVLDDVRELFGNVSGIDLHVLFLQVWRFEGNLVEHFFENGVKATGAYVFRLLVHVGGEARDCGDRVFGDVELDPFGLQQRDILLDKRILRLGQMRMKSSSFNDCSSTRMGSRP